MSRANPKSQISELVRLYEDGYSLIEISDKISVPYARLASQLSQARRAGRVTRYKKNGAFLSAEAWKVLREIAKDKDLSVERLVTEYLANDYL